MLTLIVLTRSQYFHFLLQIECSFRLVCRRLKSIDNEETSLFGPTKPVEKQVTALLREDLALKNEQIQTKSNLSKSIYHE